MLEEREGRRAQERDGVLKAEPETPLDLLGVARVRRGNPKFPFHTWLQL